MVRHLREDCGQDLVEYAMVFILLFLLMLGIIEFGTLVFSQNSVANVAREGARWGVVRRSAPAPSTYLPAIGATIGPQICATAGNAIVQAACSKALAIDLERVQVTVSRPSPGASLVVYVVYDYTPFFAPIGALLPSSLQLDSSATMRLE